MNDALLAELTDWLRIPSISTGEGTPEDLVRGAEWAAAKVRAAGGSADLVTIDGGNPLVVGELNGPEGAPTVLIYGHYDVQGVGDLSLWTSPPFEPTIRDGRLYARGAADDKGNFFPLLYAAGELAKAGALPVNIRVLLEGEEEVGGESVGKWVRADERGADAAIVFDSGMEDEHTPAITVGLRGIVQPHIVVRTGERDLHQGLYGGVAMNAANVLHRMLAAVLPDERGRVRDELMVGVAPVAEVERESWARLTAGAQILADAGARELTAGAAEEFYERAGAMPCLDIDHLETGAPRTVLPVEAKATFTMRLAPGQQVDQIQPLLERLMRDAAPAGAELSFTYNTGEASHFDPEAPVLRLAGEAIARATGLTPAYVRSGGAIPVVADLSSRGIPTIVSGFSLPEDAFHAPDESYRLASLELGEAASRELLQALAGL